MKKAGIILLAGLVVMNGLTGCARTDAKTAYEDGSSSLESGKYKAAETAFRDVLETKYYKAEAYRGLGLAQLSEQDYADACISLEKSLLNSSGKSTSFIRDVNLYLAFSRLHNDEDKKAEEIYDRLIKKNPKDSEVYFLRGRLKLTNQEYSSARKDFNRAVEINPDYDLYINIYQVYQSMSISGDGSRFLEQALKKVKDDEKNSGYDRALVNYYLKNYQDARDELVKIVKEDDTNSKAVFLLGEVYLSMDDVDDARALYKSHVNDAKNAASAYNGLVLCDLAEKDYTSALRNCKAGLEFNDSHANQGLLFNQIVIYENQQEWAQAKKLAKAYVAKYPTDEAGNREYAFLKTR